MQIFPLNVSDADKLTILQTHNSLRSRVAMGLETRGMSGPQPPAANMRQLTWDAELAVAAQTWANQCIFKHDDNRNVGK